MIARFYLGPLGHPPKVPRANVPGSVQSQQTTDRATYICKMLLIPSRLALVAFSPPWDRRSINISPPVPPCGMCTGKARLQISLPEQAPLVTGR